MTYSGGELTVSAAQLPAKTDRVEAILLRYGLAVGHVPHKIVLKTREIREDIHKKRGFLVVGPLRYYPPSLMA